MDLVANISLQEGSWSECKQEDFPKTESCESIQLWLLPCEAIWLTTSLLAKLGNSENHRIPSLLPALAFRLVFLELVPNWLVVCKLRETEKKNPPKKKLGGVTGKISKMVSHNPPSVPYLEQPTTLTCLGGIDPGIKRGIFKKNRSELWDPVSCDTVTKRSPLLHVQSIGAHCRKVYLGPRPLPGNTHLVGPLFLRKTCLPGECLIVQAVVDPSIRISIFGCSNQ